MSINKKIISLLLVAIALSSCSQEEKTRKTIFILLDGIPADVLENTATPFLDEIASKGGYARAYVGGEKGGASESPMVSAVGYNHLLTGTWANKHNVYGNGIKAPNYDYWSIFKVAKNHNSNVKTAVFSTWLDNRTKLIGEGLEGTDYLQLDFSFDGFEHDTIRFPHDEERQYIKNIDELVANKAAEYVADQAPDLSWVYLEFTDDMGHRFGDSPEMTEAVKLADDQVGRVWKSIQKREAAYNEEWMIVITTDHGRTADTGKGHGGHSDRERTTWIVTNKSNLAPSFYSQPGVVDIMPSIVDFMEFEMPERIRNQLDGESFLEKK